MKDLKHYIIDESLKDKIKEFFNKFKKDKSEVKSVKPVEEYKDQIVTEQDIDDIIKQKMKADTQGYMFNHVEMTMLGKYKPVTSEYGKKQAKFMELSYKQGMLDYAYRNFAGTLNEDKFGEKDCDRLYYKASKLEDRGIGLCVLGRYFYGRGLAEELNLKCETKIDVDLEKEYSKQ